MSVPTAPPAGATGLEGVELVVVGGGLLGGAVARLAAAGGARVTVASQTSRPHAGFWRRYTIGAGAFPAWIPRDARVVVAIGPKEGQPPTDVWGAAAQRFVASLTRGGRRVVVCGPAAGVPAFEGLAATAGDAQVVRLTSLFGIEDRLTWPIVRALREGRPARLPRAAPDVWALHVEDAARVILRFDGEPLTLRGPELLTPDLVAGAIADRYGGAWSRAWGRGEWRADDLAVAAAQRDVAEGWDESRFGARMTLRAWSDRLPGPRRRR